MQRVLGVRGGEHGAAKAGRARGGEAGQGILHHDAPPAASSSASRARLKPWGSGLQAATSSAATISPKCGAQAGELEHQLDLPPERAGHDGEPIALDRGRLDELGRARHQPHVARIDRS